MSECPEYGDPGKLKMIAVVCCIQCGDWQFYEAQEGHATVGLAVRWAREDDWSKCKDGWTCSRCKTPSK